MLAVLALLAGGYFLCTKMFADDGSGKDTAADETYTAADLDPNDLTNITIRTRRTSKTDDGEEKTEITGISFHLNDSSDRWIWDENETVPLDNSKFSSLASAFIGRTSDYRLDVAKDKLADYGLAEPAGEVVFGFSDGKSETYRVGSKNTFNGMYYFSSADVPTSVYMVDPSVFEAINITINDMILFDTLPTLTASSLSSLEFTRNGDKYVYTRFPSGDPDYYSDAYTWSLSVNGGERFPVSSAFSEEMENALTYMYLMKCVSYDKSEQERFGLDDPVRMRVGYSGTDTSSESSAEITVGKNFDLYFGAKDPDENYYVRTGDSVLVYTLYYSSFFGRLFDAKLTEIRPAEICSADTDDISSAVFTAGGKTVRVNITHGADTDVFTDLAGKELSEEKLEKFKAVLDALAETEAKSDTSLTEKKEDAEENEIFRAEFTFVNGKRTSGTLVVTRWAGNYCRAAFLDRDSQLITLSDAEKLAELVMMLAK